MNAGKAALLLLFDLHKSKMIRSFEFLITLTFLLFHLYVSTGLSKLASVPTGGAVAVSAAAAGGAGAAPAGEAPAGGYFNKPANRVIIVN